MNRRKRVQNEDRPSLRDDKYAESQYWLRRITWTEYLEVKQFQGIFDEFWNNRLRKIQLRLGPDATHNDLICFIDNWID
jgi:hypothetical protein